MISANPSISDIFKIQLMAHSEKLVARPKLKNTHIDKRQQQWEYAKMRHCGGMYSVRMLKRPRRLYSTRRGSKVDWVPSGEEKIPVVFAEYTEDRILTFGKIL